MIYAGLKEKLGDCQNTVKSLCGNKSAYIETNQDELYINDPIDSNQPIQLVSGNSYHQLKITNTVQQPVCLIKTDKCLLANSINKKCDCVLVSAKDLVFIEIKDTTLNGRYSARGVAINQLEETIVHFRNVNAIESKNLKAVICFKSNKYCIIKSSSQSAKATYFEKYNAALMEGNEIILA